MNNRFDGARSRVRPAGILREFQVARRLALASTVSVLALSGGAATAQETTGTAADARWSAHGTATARVGTERQIGEMDLFVPLWQNDSAMLFGDARVQTDDSGNQEGNIGLGYRRMGETWIGGGYGFFDYRKSDATGNTFSQGTFGVEALSDTLDLRANVYVPEGGEQAASGGPAVQNVGGSLQLRFMAERALPGADGEIGYRLWQAQDGDTELRAFAGGYYFDAVDYETVAGGRGRVEARLFDLGFLGEGSRFTLGAEVTQDNVRDTQGFALARLTIPFGGGRRSARGGLDRRMTDYVVRDVDIITGTAATGAAEAVTYVGLAGNVTVLNAADDIVAATAGDVTTDIFIVDGSAGAFSTTATIALQDGQTLLGAGGGIDVVGVDSGTRATYVGARPTINGDVGGGAVITLASNTTVDGIDIANRSTLDSSEGIYGTGVTGATVRDTTITTGARNGYGVYLSSGTSNTVENNTITTSGRDGSGVVLSGGANDTVDNNTITTSGHGGYGVSVALGTGTVSNNSITTTALSGIGVRLNGNNITVDSNTITTGEEMAPGINLWDGSSFNTITNNNVTTLTTGFYGAFGIRMLTADDNTISNNTFTTSASEGHGVKLSSGARNEFNGNTIVTGGTNAYGFHLTGGTVDSNTGTGNSYSGPGGACVVDAVTASANTIDLCP